MRYDVFELSLNPVMLIYALLRKMTVMMRTLSPRLLTRTRKAERLACAGGMFRHANSTTYCKTLINR